jgi:hypothetical protein
MLSLIKDYTYHIIAIIIITQWIHSQSAIEVLELHVSSKEHISPINLVQ